MDSINLKFNGALASSGRLLFYEHSRSIYAFSRFIATIECYRRTGRVPNRIHMGDYDGILVVPPQKGSFITEVIVPAGKEVVAGIATTQLSTLFGYVWNTLTPFLAKDESLALELAKIQLKAEEERTKQSQQETARIAELRKIVEEGQVTQRQTLELFRWAQTTPNTAVGRLDVTAEDLISKQKEIESDIERQEFLKARQHEIAGLDEEDMSRITSRVQPLIGDISLPLRKSAESVSIGTHANDNLFFQGNAERIKQLTRKRLDEDPISFEARIRSYDRDSGTGKLISQEFLKNMPFSLSRSNQLELHPLVLQAMNRRTVTCEGIAYKDLSGNYTSLIITDILL